MSTVSWVEMHRPAKVETTHLGETYANVAGTIFGWFVATADTIEPDWLPLSFRVSLFVTHILAPLFVLRWL